MLILLSAYPIWCLVNCNVGCCFKVICYSLMKLLYSLINCQKFSKAFCCWRMNHEWLTHSSRIMSNALGLSDFVNHSYVDMCHKIFASHDRGRYSNIVDGKYIRFARKISTYSISIKACVETSSIRHYENQLKVNWHSTKFFLIQLSSLLATAVAGKAMSKTFCHDRWFLTSAGERKQ